MSDELTLDWIVSDNETEASTTQASTTNPVMSAPAWLRWQVAEPDLLFTWAPVSAAASYEILWSDSGVTRTYSQPGTEIRLTIPRMSLGVLRVRAIAEDGTRGEPITEEVQVSGFAYSFNELVAIALPLATGTYANLCFANSTSIRRASLLGATPSLPIVNDNDCDLYTFVDDWTSQVVSDMASVPAGWFKNDFWLARAGSFESASLDLGAVYTGRIKTALTATVTHYGASGPVSAYARVLPEYINDIQVTDLIDAHAFVETDLLVSPDGITWTEASDGDWITAMRYVKLVIRAAELSPLTEIKVTAGTVYLDVPDITETGTKLAVTTAGVAVALTRSYHQVKTVLATAQGNAKAYATNITPTGFTLWTDSAGGAAVDWFAKGY